MSYLPINPSHIRRYKNYAIVELRRKDKPSQWAKISKEDVPLVENLSWFPAFTYGKTYAARRHYVGNKRFTTLYLHRLIASQMGEVRGKNIDFVNGDPFDCRRENLRILSRSTHRALRNSVNPSGYRGVTPAVTEGKWVCKMLYNGKCFHTTHDTVEEAARQYDVLVQRYRKDFPKEYLNFPQ